MQIGQEGVSYVLSPESRIRLVDPKRLTAAEVDRDVRGWEKTSDHAPVWIELSDKPQRRQSKAANQSA